MKRGRALTPASFPHKGQVTKEITVNWFIPSTGQYFPIVVFVLDLFFQLKTSQIVFFWAFVGVLGRSVVIEFYLV